MSARALVIVFAVSVCLSGCSREKSDWRSAQAADTAESYQQFIDEHPESAQVASARERLGLRAGQKNVLLRVVLRHVDRTLTRAEANSLRDRVYAAVHDGKEFTRGGAA